MELGSDFNPTRISAAIAVAENSMAAMPSVNNRSSVMVFSHRIHYYSETIQ
jgi:hypothetical protein